MIRDFENLTIERDATIREAMAHIDRNGLGITLVVADAGVLLGTVTDGDIRRAILANRALDEPLDTIMCRDPQVATEETKEDEVFAVMKTRKLRLVPVVSDDRVVVGVYEFARLAIRHGDSVERLPAVLMAGGLGSRLHPHTQDTPKPLLDVGGQSILGRIVDHLKNAGVEDIFIATRHMSEQIEAHFGSGASFGVNIDYVREQKRLGTAGALKHLQGRVNQPFLVMNGDLLTDFKVQEMVNFHGEHDAAMTVGVRHYQFQVPYGVVEVDGVSIGAISEKPSYDFFVNAGIYILDPSVLELIPVDTRFDITELIDALIAKSDKVVSFPIHEHWMDIGRPEDLERARGLFDDNPVE